MLTLSEVTVAQIVRQASAHPEVEVCGLVWASEAGQKVRVLRNVHSEPTKYYRTAPNEVREAFKEMDQEGGEPLAWYHSHPSGKSDPSETDMEGAFNVGMHYLIACPREVVLYAGGVQIGQVTEWKLTAWECISMGILVQADYEVVP